MLVVDNLALKQLTTSTFICLLLLSLYGYSGYVPMLVVLLFYSSLYTLGHFQFPQLEGNVKLVKLVVCARLLPFANLSGVILVTVLGTVLWFILLTFIHNAIPSHLPRRGYTALSLRVQALW